MPSRPSKKRPNGRHQGKKSPSSSGKARLAIRKNKPLGEELRKIAKLQLEAAIRAIRENNASPEPVHDARTSIKKIRAILQATATVVPRDQRLHAAMLLREASSRLAQLRDTEVQVRTLDALIDQAGLPVDDFAAIRAGLADVAKQRRLNDVRQIPRVREFLKNVLEAADHWPLTNLTGKDLKQRIRRAYRRGRTALDLAREDGSIESFHVWRKQLKHLWYLLRITAPCWPHDASFLIEVTGKISEQAGQERDLALLAETLSQGPQSRFSTILRDQIAATRSTLRNEAVKAGLVFYEMKAKAFVEALDL